MIRIVVLSVALAGCATYSDSVYELERHIVNGQPEPALASLEKQDWFGRDAVVTLLNKAMLQRMARRYAESNATFEAVKQLIETREALSVSEQATALVINEAMRSFIPEDFERAMIHLYAALNYIELGQLDEARVEALQVDLFLGDLAKKRPNDARVYSEDALCRYLAGMIFEELGEYSDALIAYRKAYEAYEKYSGPFAVSVPPSLVEDLLRLTDRQGLAEEHRAYREKFPTASFLPVEQMRERGELVVMIHNGLAPTKRSEEIRVIEPNTGRLISIAVPRYERRYDPVRRLKVNAGGITRDAPIVENVAAIAERSLEARLPGLTARAVARAALKYNLTSRAQREGGDLAAIMVNIAGAVTEVADTRSWTTLPEAVYMARLALPPGRYAVDVDIEGPGGASLKQVDFGTVTLRAGHITYLEAHWASAKVLGSGLRH